MWLRLCYVARNAAAIQRWSWISFYAISALLWRFEPRAISLRKFWASSKQAPGYSDYDASGTLLLQSKRFYCSVGVLATIRRVLSKISERTEIVAQWNGAFNRLLTHYQMTNFRLFQTERVCRRQFQIWRKWKKETGRKHCGKRKNCSLRAISPFPTVFSKGLFPRGVKRCHCVGMG